MRARQSPEQGREVCQQGKLVPEPSQGEGQRPETRATSGDEAGRGGLKAQAQESKRGPGQKEWEQGAQLTDGAVGARIARAGAVTLVLVKTEADTDTLVLAWVVTTGVHCGREAEIRNHSR